MLDRSASFSLDRRQLGVGALSGAAAAVLPSRLRGAFDKKLRLAVIGVANRGGANLNGVAREDLVALCDVDRRYLEKAGKRFPNAKLYSDWRVLLTELEGALDGVVISTPDHTHACIAAAAMRRGLHVYLEKPLAHSVDEVRMLTELAAETGVVTQMGTQIHALPNYRKVVERIRSGALGQIAEVDVWCGTGVWGGGARPKTWEPVPDYLDWESWLGPAPERPFHPGTYHPGHWRRFWDFGGGNQADMGCHFIDLVFWAMGLVEQGRTPVEITCDGPAVDPEVAPKGVITTWRFPATDSQPELTLRWHDAGIRPKRAKDYGVGDWGSGVLFLGENGALCSDYYRHKLMPEERFAESEAPYPSIPDALTHHGEWIVACKAGGRCSSDFSYAGPLTETVLLGNVSYRLSGRTIGWDSKALRCLDSKGQSLPDANALLKREWRPGFEI